VAVWRNPLNQFALCAAPRSITTNAPASDGFPLQKMMQARARCLTLMLAPFTLSHRHAIFGLWMSLSACLSLPRARGGRRRLSNGFRAFQPSWLADDFRRGVRQQTSSLARLDGKRWTQLLFARARMPVFPLLSGFRETVDTIQVRAREGGRSQTGETPPVVSAASFRSVSAPEGLPLRETVRPHSEIIGNGLTPQPSDYAPGAPPAGRGVSRDGRALPRRARTNPGHAN